MLSLNNNVFKYKQLVFFMAKILCLEGCSGTGKTTQTKLIPQFLSSIGKSCNVINEKQYEPFRSEVIRWHQIRVVGELFTWDQIRRFAKARGETHKTHFLETTDYFDFLLFDRSYFTSAVYQCSKEIDSEKIIELNLSEGAIPVDYGFLLECDPKESVRRINNRRIEVGKYNLPSVHETLPEIISLRNLYKKMAEKHSELINITSSKNSLEVLEQIVKYLK